MLKKFKETLCLGFVVIYLRYRLVSELNRDADKILKSLNILSLIVVLVALLGMFGVANFQVFYDCFYEEY